MGESAMQQLVGKAQARPSRVVFPESGEQEILEAASMAAARGVARPILVGDPEAVDAQAAQSGISLEGVEIVPLPDADEAARLAAGYAASGGVLLREKICAKRMKMPLFYAAMLVRTGGADAMVAGLSHSTADVIFAAKAIIGMRAGISTPSSMLLMEIPGYDGPQGEQLVFADCGVCIQPTPEEIADIAIATADTVRRLLGWEPREALLSFSTKGSARHPQVDETLQALELIHQREPGLLADGELQLDAAVVPAVAARKVPGQSDVAGQANVLIFPDLAAGNITYKAVQRFARANAYGPFLQGFEKTVSDLSRGSSVEDILGVTVMASVCAQEG